MLPARGLSPWQAGSAPAYLPLAEIRTSGDLRVPGVIVPRSHEKRDGMQRQHWKEDPNLSRIYFKCPV